MLRAYSWLFSKITLCAGVVWGMESYVLLEIKSRSPRVSQVSYRLYYLFFLSFSVSPSLRLCVTFFGQTWQCSGLSSGSIHRDHSWQCSGIKPRSVTCKTIALPAVLSFKPDCCSVVLSLTIKGEVHSINHKSLTLPPTLL